MSIKSNYVVEGPHEMADFCYGCEEAFVTVVIGITLWTLDFLCFYLCTFISFFLFVRCIIVKVVLRYIFTFYLVLGGVVKSL